MKIHFGCLSIIHCQVINTSHNNPERAVLNWSPTGFSKGPFYPCVERVLLEVFRSNEYSTGVDLTFLLACSSLIHFITGP